VFGRIDGAPHRADVAHHAGRGLVVDDANSLDCVVGVFLQALFDGGRIGGLAPVAAHEFRLDSQACRPSLPERGRSGRSPTSAPCRRTTRVHQGRFPGPRARGGIDDDRLLGLEKLVARCAAPSWPGIEFRPAVIDGRVSIARRSRSGTWSGRGFAGNAGRWDVSSGAFRYCSHCDPVGTNPSPHIKGEVLSTRPRAAAIPPTPRSTQVEPVGIVVPRDETDLALALDVARDAKAAIPAARGRDLAVRPGGGRGPDCRFLEVHARGRGLRQGPRRGHGCSPASCSTSSMPG